MTLLVPQGVGRFEMLGSRGHKYREKKFLWFVRLSKLLQV
jgi:hypothetical protein